MYFLARKLWPQRSERRGELTLGTPDEAAGAGWLPWQCRAAASTEAAGAARVTGPAQRGPGAALPCSQREGRWRGRTARVPHTAPGVPHAAPASPNRFFVATLSRTLSRGRFHSSPGNQPFLSPFGLTGHNCSPHVVPCALTDEYLVMAVLRS